MAPLDRDVAVGTLGLGLGQSGLDGFTFGRSRGHAQVLRRLQAAGLASGQRAERGEQDKGTTDQGRTPQASGENTPQAATAATATSDVGRKIFQPRRINWS